MSVPYAGLRANPSEIFAAITRWLDARAVNREARGSLPAPGVVRMARSYCKAESFDKDSGAIVGVSLAGLMVAI